ncbi:MAG: DUF2497 domain-containing protein [Hyphomicrobiales bacterium]|nr:DUF2497 domain-containing protein [Hyphomicrobiales bacterium]MCP5374421.1 DUF2497 domain-containing protein [Hyphomicrobiales bacterium]
MSDDNATETGQQEPSMEDILASIRKILSEEEEGGDAQAQAAPAPAPQPDPQPEPRPEPQAEFQPEPRPEPRPEPEAAAPQPEMLAEPRPEPHPEPRPQPEPALDSLEDLAADVVLEPQDEVEEPVPPREYRAPEPEPEPEPADDVLDLTPSMISQDTLPPPGASVVSPPTHAASTDVLSELARAILSQRDIAIGSRDVTLEGLVRSMLRPLLKEWLDAHLPYLIERLVKKEIDHMVNRAERLDD